MKLLPLTALLAATTAQAQTFAPPSTAFTFAGAMYVAAPGFTRLNCPLNGTGQVTANGTVKITSVTACAGVTATNLQWPWSATGKGRVSFSVNGTDCTDSDTLGLSGGVFTFYNSGSGPCVINGDVATTPAVRVAP